LERLGRWDDYDDDSVLTCRFHLIFLARHEDRQIRDEMVELLLNVAADALGGNSLGGAGIPANADQIWSFAIPPPLPL